MSTRLYDIAALFRANAYDCFDAAAPPPPCYGVGSVPTGGGTRIIEPETCCDPMSLWSWYSHRLNDQGDPGIVIEQLEVTVALDVCLAVGVDMDEDDTGHAAVAELAYQMWSSLCRAREARAFGQPRKIVVGPLTHQRLGTCSRSQTTWLVTDIWEVPV